MRHSIINFLKNPIVIGILALSITYAHLYYKEYKKKKDNPDAPNKKIDLTVPAMVGALCWFFAASYFDNCSSNDELSSDSCEKIKYINDKVTKNVLSDNQIESESVSYHFVRKGDIVIPDLDVFLDVGEF